jgi:mRNA interferase RelE/StbE
MAYEIEFSKRALRKFEALPRSAQEHLKPLISSLASNPRPPAARKMKELDKCDRVRHGDYRVVYAVYDEVLVILVLTVADRREAYTTKEIAAMRRILRERLRELRRRGR